MEMRVKLSMIELNKILYYFYDNKDFIDGVADIIFSMSFFSDRYDSVKFMGANIILADDIIIFSCSSQDEYLFFKYQDHLVDIVYLSETEIDQKHFLGYIGVDDVV